MKYFKDSFLDVARNPCQHKPQFSYGFQVNTFFQHPTENSHDFLNKTYLSLNALWFSICPFRDPKFTPKTQCLVLVTVLTYKWMKEIIIPQVIANALSCVPQNHYSHFSWALCLFSFYLFRQNVIQMALSFYFPSLTPFIRFTCVKMLVFFPDHWKHCATMGLWSALSHVSILCCYVPWQVTPMHAGSSSFSQIISLVISWNHSDSATQCNTIFLKTLLKHVNFP